jgi:hypothetical protein
MEEIRPFSGIYLPGLIAAIAERYGFAVVPNLADAAQQGAKFREGRFTMDDSFIAIKELGVYNDGIIVAAWNTDDADAIIDDVMNWTSETLKLREPILRPNRRYVSSLVVEFDISLDRAFAMFAEFIRTYGEVLKRAYDWEFPVAAARIAFSADRTLMPPHTSADLVIERRAGVPFSENRYFSSVPLRTRAHLELLKTFEDLLAAPIRA